MEKLKVKHDHKLTDIVKVCLFSLFLILPILMFIPSCLYYGFNEHATAPTTTQENLELVNFNQLIEKPNLQENIEGWTPYNNNYVTLSYSNGGLTTVIDNTGSSHYQYGITTNIKKPNIGNIYLIKINYRLGNFDYLSLDSFGGYSTFDNNGCVRWTCNADNMNRILIIPRVTTYEIGYNFTLYNCNVFNLTQMYGQGNEPTATEFLSNFTKQYYEYTESKYMYIDNGTTSEYIDISKNIYFAWQSLWEKPILQWTGYNNFNFTINAFTNIFGITQESYIANYITYLMTLLVIYVVFDIVIMVFTKLTHLFNE